MTFSAKLKIQYDSEWTSTGTYFSSYTDEMLPEEHITMEIPAEDLNTTQLFKFFSNFLRAIGHNEIGIMKGACGTAFNECQNEEDMRKVAEEYDLVLSEDHQKKLDEYDAQQDRDLRKLEAEIRDLKAKLSRCQQPDNPNYTDEEMAAMTFQEWDDMLIPGSYAAVEKGCKCPVMDNEEMPEDRKWVNGDCPLHGKLQ